MTSTPTVATYIGSDNVEAGRCQRQERRAVLGDGGNVVELAEAWRITDHCPRRRLPYRTRGLRSHARHQTANYDRAKGLKVMEDLLQKYRTGSIDGRLHA